MAEKPKFDPSKPFNVVMDNPESKPKFDPTKAFTAVDSYAPGGSDVVNEAAGLEGRFAVKNFGGTLQDQIEYLKQKNPGYEITARGGEIVAKKPGEDKYKKLDPSAITQSGFNFSFDPRGLELSDITDIGYDVAAGTAQGAATAAAGLGAATASGGSAALPAAMATSGATGAGLEALRQGIGNYLGSAKGTDLTDIAISGGVGLATPAAFGTGVSKAAIESALKNPNVVGRLLKSTGAGTLKAGEEVAPAAMSLIREGLTESQRGLVGKFKDNALSMFSGVAFPATLKSATEYAPKPLIKKMINFGLDVDPNDKMTTQRLANALMTQNGEDILGNTIISEVSTAVNKRLGDLTERYTDGLERAGVKIDLAGLKTGLEAKIEAARNAPTPALREVGEAARNVLSRVLTPAEPQMYIDELGNPLVRRTGREASFLVSPKEALDTVNKLSKIIDDSKSFGGLQKLDADARQVRTELMDVRKELQDQIYSAISDGTGDKALRADYRKLQEFRNVIEPKFKDVATAARSIQNINSPSMRYTKKILENLDSTEGTNILDVAKLADVGKFLGDPSLEAVSRGGATSTGKYNRAADTGAAVAATLGGFVSPGAVAPAAQVGRTAASFFTSPAAVATYLKNKAALKGAGEEVLRRTKGDKVIQTILNQRAKMPTTLQNVTTPVGAFPTAWNLMRGE
jgi:hypothetical protein